MSQSDAELVPLLKPRDGVPDPVADAAALEDAADRLHRGHGPLAVDTERASGYRYFPRAYLVQVRREGAGTFLFDPVSVPDLSSVAEAVGQDTEWILHAASQDLPALGEVGMFPAHLFDTELAGRLAGLERVGLGPLVARLLGVHLEKGHGAADWSRRPLPREWLTYAALDVELLIDVRQLLADMLAEQGKLEWAQQEFAHVLAQAAAPPSPRPDPWRRTSGINKVSGARGLAVVRSLWLARDELGRMNDLAPGRVLPDAAIIAAARDRPGSLAELRALPGFRSRHQRRRLARWWGAIAQAYALPESELPGRPPRSNGVPAPNRWSRHDPAAADRLARVRKALEHVAEGVSMPVEQVLAPDLVKRLAWEPPPAATPGAVTERLRSMGARPWQLSLCAEPLAAALVEAS